MRPSALVKALKGADGPRGPKRVRVTDMDGAGRPVVWSRTWHVIGSLGGDGEAEVCGVTVEFGSVILVFSVLR